MMPLVFIFIFIWDPRLVMGEIGDDLDWDKLIFDSKEHKQTFKNELFEIQKSERFHPFQPIPIDKLDIYSKNVSAQVTQQLLHNETMQDTFYMTPESQARFLQTYGKNFTELKTLSLKQQNLVKNHALIQNPTKPSSQGQSFVELSEQQKLHVYRKINKKEVILNCWVLFQRRPVPVSNSSLSLKCMASLCPFPSS